MLLSTETLTGLRTTSTFIVTITRQHPHSFFPCTGAQNYSVVFPLYVGTLICGVCAVPFHNSWSKGISQWDDLPRSCGKVLCKAKAEMTIQMLLDSWKTIKLLQWSIPSTSTLQAEIIGSNQSWLPGKVESGTTPLHYVALKSHFYLFVVVQMEARRTVVYKTLLHPGIYM